MRWCHQCGSLIFIDVLIWALSHFQFTVALDIRMSNYICYFSKSPIFLCYEISAVVALFCGLLILNFKTFPRSVTNPVLYENIKLKAIERFGNEPI